MFKRLGLCMMLLVCITAFEKYDDNRLYGMEPDQDEDYNGENLEYQDVGPYWPGPQVLDDPVQSLILYQLFNSLQNRDDARLRMPYLRPTFRIMDNPLAGYGPVPFSEMMAYKGAVAKKHLSAPDSASAAGTTSAQKGKPGNPIVKPLRKER